jgi:hypothetical protein
VAYVNYPAVGALRQAIAGNRTRCSMNVHSSIFVEGARRVWARQRILWWIFVVNLVIAFTSVMSVSHRIGDVTDHSLAAQQLVQGFDWGVFSELRTTPGVNYGATLPQSISGVLVFFVFMLFLTGGILASYANEHRLCVRDFFGNCGAFFWRWVRLLILLLLIMVPIALASRALFDWAGRLINDAAGEKTGYIVFGVFAVLILLVLMAVRLWFDMAQVRIVIEDEKAVRVSCGRAFQLTLSNFGPLFWLYLRTSALAWFGLAAGMWLWTRLSGGSAIIMFELVLLWWIATRLWQRASEVVWYQRFVVAQQPSPFEVPDAVPAFPTRPMAPDTLPPSE